MFLTNLAAIVASAFLVFYVVRMDAPDVRTKIDALIQEGASHDRLYAVLQGTTFSGALGHVGKLRWRIVMLVAILAMLFVPLSKSLLQVRDEARSRAAVREALRVLGPADTFVTQQVDITAAEIAIHLVAAAPVPKTRIGEAEKLLLRRTGKDVKITIRKVASEEELAMLRQQLKTPSPTPPAPQDLESIRADVVSRLERPVKEMWPSEAGELLTYEMGFTPDGLLVRIRYRSAKTLDSTAQEILSKVLKAQLKIDKLRPDLEQEKLASVPAKPGNNQTHRTVKR